MTPSQAQAFAAEWVAAWNRHDVDAVLAHYTEDFAMTTPMIQKLLGIPTGTLQGKQAVGDYWRAALVKIPDLQFSIIETTCGVDTVSIYYNAVLGRDIKKASRLMTEHVLRVYRTLQDGIALEGIRVSEEPGGGATEE